MIEGNREEDPERLNPILIQARGQDQDRKTGEDNKIETNRDQDPERLNPILIQARSQFQEVDSII